MGGVISALLTRILELVDGGVCVLKMFTLPSWESANHEVGSQKLEGIRRDRRASSPEETHAIFGFPVGSCVPVSVTVSPS